MIVHTAGWNRMPPRHVRGRAWRWGTRVGVRLLACVVGWGVAWTEADAARQAKVRPDTAAGEVVDSEFAADRLVEKAQDLLTAQEHDRGVKMLENVIEQYPKSRVRYKALLALGRHLVGAQKYNDAIRYLRGLNELNKPDVELTGENRDWYLEAQYLTGVAFFQMRQYGNAFTVLRAITRDYPNTVWANQSYYFIGLCHFAQKNWNRAIEALTMVGTFVDPASPAVERVEAGRRFYAKIADADIPILYQTGKDIVLQIETKGGDRERMTVVPMGAREGLGMASLPTAAGTATTNDGAVQVVGGDVITVKYYDDNSAEGRKNVLRESRTQVVSSAALDFTLGTFEAKAEAAFLGQPVFLLATDLDQDATAGADKVTVRVISRYKPEFDESAARSVNVDKLFLAGDEGVYEVRDELTATLTEQGAAPVHSGRFGGSVEIRPLAEGTQADKSDAILSCGLDDEIVAFYVDERHIDGDTRREAKASVKVVGEIDGRPAATQNVVFDPVVKARKQLVESTAFLELTRIFKSMGLMKNAVEKSKEGLERVQQVLVTQAPIPSSLKEEAFRIKWDLLIEAEDYPNAIATCHLFSQLFPDSPFADEALMKIGAVRLEARDVQGAINIFASVLRLPHSRAKAEAQYRIAEAHAALADAPSRSLAMQEFKRCAEQYPDSEYAGKALGKLVDYYVDTRDYAQADYLLEQIFQDYPDGSFLDSMLLKWVIASYRMGNLDKARDKCTQLLFEYPTSPFAAQAKNLLPKLEKKPAAETAAAP